SARDRHHPGPGGDRLSLAGLARRVARRGGASRDDEALLVYPRAAVDGEGERTAGGRGAERHRVLRLRGRPLEGDPRGPARPRPRPGPRRRGPGRCGVKVWVAAWALAIATAGLVQSLAAANGDDEKDKDKDEAAAADELYPS